MKGFGNLGKWVGQKEISASREACGKRFTIQSIYKINSMPLDVVLSLERRQSKKDSITKSGMSL